MATNDADGNGNDDEHLYKSSEGSVSLSATGAVTAVAGECGGRLDHERIRAGQRTDLCVHRHVGSMQEQRRARYHPG